MLKRDEKLKTSIDSLVKKQSLAKLAFTMQKKHLLVCTREQAERIMTKGKNEYNTKKILNEILDHGLMQGERKVWFLHQSVQEYFVGLELCNIAVLEDSTEYDRWKAAVALGNLGDAQAVEPLIAALEDSSSDVRGRAAEALAKIDGQDFPSIDYLAVIGLG